MGNYITCRLGYGIALFSNNGDEDSRLETLRALGDDWVNILFERLYPDGAPECIEISNHYLNGHDRHAEYRGHYELPLLLIQEGFGDSCSYSITGSTNAPDDASAFLATLEIRKSDWNFILADFVDRCRKAGITIPQPDPKPWMFLNWDDIGH